MDIIVLCHGRLKESTSFDLQEDQVVQYRGNFGAPLPFGNDRAIVQALLENPEVTEKQIANQIKGYDQQDPLVGPRKGYSPDFALSGDDNNPAFCMNMRTHKYVRLKADWKSTVSALVQEFGTPLWINLLCCSTLREAKVEVGHVRPELEAKPWEQLLLPRHKVERWADLA